MVHMLLGWMGLLMMAQLGLSQDLTTSQTTTSSINETQDDSIEYGDFGLNIFHLKSTTDSITIGWNVSLSQNVSSLEHINHYVIKYRKDNMNFESDQLGRSNLSYEIIRLTYDTYYNVCMTVNYQHQDATEELYQCRELYTIPLIHYLSLIVLLCVLAYIVFVFILAYYCWRKKQKGADDEEQLTAEEEEKLNQEPPVENERNGRPPKLRPYLSSIEDRDIPWIDQSIDQSELDA